MTGTWDINLPVRAVTQDLDCSSDVYRLRAAEDRSER